MELILISEDKLKIMLSREDMEKYHIEDPDYSHLSTRCAIKSILREARSLVGFETEGESFFVQLFTSRGGGCEIFVSKGDGELGVCEDTRDVTRTECGVDKTQRSDSLCAEKPSTRSYRSVYSFSDLHSLVCVCRRLCRMTPVPQGKVYRDVYGGYFLSLTHTDLSPYSRLSPYTFILEYGKRESTDGFDRYIAEYASLACNGGVEVFGKL